MTLSFEFFRALADSYSVVPLVRDLIADQETPISLAAKLRNHGKFFLLESMEGGAKWGRYSILGFDIRKELTVHDDAAWLRTPSRHERLPGNPVDALQTYLAGFNAWQPPNVPRFIGGAVGYFSFESVRFFERCGEVKPNDGAFPDAYFMIADHLAVFDHQTHTLKLICCVHPAEYADHEAAFAAGHAALDHLETLISQPAPVPENIPTPASATAAAAATPKLDMRTNMTRDAYEGMVGRAKRYIADGDIIQVVLAQHFSATITADPFDVYRALRFINPSPYLFYLHLADGRAIAGSSPEVMVRVTGDQAELRPIAGTRPRGADEAEDERLAKELLADPKEIAEHVMLVDLARNDLGRIATIGSVNVVAYMIIERYSHVMHIVSQVQATLRPDCDALDVFKASFPAGTLSGAPKVRAMEIINELEPTTRGPYGGALGYIGYGGRVMDMAITIRTVVIDGNQATVTAGAGIVYDSVPATEWEETRHKSRGMRRALELAERGLRLGGNV